MKKAKEEEEEEETFSPPPPTHLDDLNNYDPDDPRIVRSPPPLQPCPVLVRVPVISKKGGKKR
jgi:hypothetical protein